MFWGATRASKTVITMELTPNDGQKTVRLGGKGQQVGGEVLLVACGPFRGYAQPGRPTEARPCQVTEAPMDGISLRGR